MLVSLDNQFNGLHCMEELLARRKARASLEQFALYMTRDDPHPLMMSAMHRKLAATLQDVVDGRIKRLIINMPPEHGKSSWTNAFMSSYIIGKKPDTRFIVASNTRDLSENFSRAVKRYVDSDEFRSLFPGVELAADSQATGKWRIEGTRGIYQAVSAGSKTAGKRSDLIICDDVLGSYADAMSPTIRESVWNWFVADVLTRGALGSIIVVATRWHEDDLCGRLIERMKSGKGEKWEVLSLPAFAEIDDALGRQRGDPLWAEGGFTAEKLLQIKMSGLSDSQFSALYQQRPIPEGGGLLQRPWWQVWSGRRNARGEKIDNKMPTIDYLVMSLDTALKKKDQNDYYAMTVWGLFKPIEGKDLNLILLDAWQEKGTLHEILTKLREEWDMWTEDMGGIPPDYFICEDSTSGPHIQTELARLKTHRGHTIPVTLHGVHQDKEVRAKLTNALLQRGLVWAPGRKVGGARSDTEFADFAEMVVSQCESFPAGKHDDLVDSCTQAWNFVRRQLGLKAPTDFEDEDAKPKQRRKDPIYG